MESDQGEDLDPIANINQTEVEGTKAALATPTHTSAQTNPPTKSKKIGSSLGKKSKP